MSPFGLALRSMRHRWRTSLAAVLGVALALAMVGASLVTGASLRGTLSERASRRVGAIDHALVAPGRLFRDALASELKVEGLQAAPVLVARGSVEDPDSGRVIAGVDVWGVDARFADVFGTPLPWLDRFAGTSVALSDALAKEWPAPPSSLVVRFERLDDLPRESPLAGAGDAVIQLFADDVRAATAEAAGEFSLVSTGARPRAVFVPLATLQERLEADGRVNGLLVRAPDVTTATLTDRLRDLLRLSDLSLLADPLPEGGTVVRTSRVFLDPPLEPVLSGLARSAARPSLSYFVNGLTIGERTTPYSIVTAIEGEGAPADDAIVLNEWLANDLGAKPGDALVIRYYVPTGPGGLEERSHTLTVSNVVPMAQATPWKAHVPPFPGVADKANCREWEPGMPVELSRIRDTDEQYWDDHGLTPKAFVSLSTGRKLWTNRWGDTTALALQAALGADARLPVDPSALGLGWVPVGALSRAQAVPSVDFSGLFLALAFLGVVTSLLLAIQLLVAGVEDRADEARLLEALGIPPISVRRMLEAEAALVVFAGYLLGLPLAVGAGAGVVRLLNGGWADAVAGLSLDFHGPDASFPAAMFVLAVVTFVPVVLAVQRSRVDAPEAGGAPPRVGAWIAGCIAIACFSAVSWLSGPAQVVAPALGGVALLVALLLVVIHPRSSKEPLDWPAIQSRRHPRRDVRLSLVVGLGVFLVATVGANRHAVHPGGARTSGTGGFGAIVKLSVPLVKDPRTPDARQELDLDDATLDVLQPVPLRVSDGDDASCRSLGQAVRPTILGVDSSHFTGRFAPDADWSRLDEPGADVPVIGDEGTVRWGLKRGVGDRFELVGEGGRRWPARIAAILPNNVLQGSLVVSRARFESLFPSEPGFRWFLVEGPPDRTGTALERFTNVLADHGVVVEDTSERLRSLLAVENAYLAVFLATGWLALLLGGLGVVVVLWRDVLRRRSELALLQALGWPRSRVEASVRRTFARIVLVGLGAGALASSVSLLVLSRVASSAVDVAGFTTGLAIVVVFVAGGVLWASRRVVARVSLSVLSEE